jgi:pyruvate-ferredoxin/flavodoxin oxidoreductase
MFGKKDEKQFKYPGVRMAMDGNTAVIMCEREASDAAGAYPITPSTQMGEYWAEEVGQGPPQRLRTALDLCRAGIRARRGGGHRRHVHDGLRAVNFSSGQGIAFMHESLYAAVGKRLPYVLNIGARAITKSTLNVHAVTTTITASTTPASASSSARAPRRRLT